MSQSDLEGGTVEPEEEGWVKFDGYDELFVSVRKDGSISIYSTAYEEFFAHSEAVILFYNQEKDLVAIKPANEYDENDDSKRKLHESNNLGKITAKNFVKQYDIGSKNTIKYEAEWNEQREMLIFDPTSQGKNVSKKSS